MNELSKPELTNIGLLVDRHLRRSGSTEDIEAGQHLDEDALNAFVEGSLSETEGQPIVRHLVDCGLCRRVTAQLVRLAVVMGELEEVQRIVADPPEPSNIRQFLADLASRIGLGASDDTVFAYHAPAEDFRPKDESAKGDQEPDPEN